MTRRVLVGALVAGVLLLAAAGWGIVWLLGSDDEAEGGGVLPDPGSPVVDPLVAPPAAGLGWSWVNPLPRAMPSWLAVAAGGPERVALAGRRGDAARFLGGKLYRWRTGTDATLRDVAWLDSDRALAVGDAGTARVLGPSEPVKVRGLGAPVLRAVTLQSEGSAITVGDGGTVWRLDLANPEAPQVRPVSSGTEVDLLDVHARKDGRVYAVGMEGTILRVGSDGVVPEESGTNATLRAVGGCDPGSLYAAGDGGRILRRGEKGWRPLRGTGREPWAALACDRNRSVVVGREGGVRLLHGTRSVGLDSGTDEALHAVSSSSDSLTWIVGHAGRMAVLDRHRIRWRTTGNRAPILGLAELGGTLVAVGGWGTILRQRRGRMQAVDSPTEHALAAVVRLDERRLLALGDGGSLVEITWDEVRLLSPPVEAGWRDAVAADGEVLAVGVDGALLRGMPGAFRASRVEGAGTLWAVAGHSGDAVAVGEQGMVVHIGSDGVRERPCDEPFTLRGVARFEAGTWAVGDGGIIVRVDGEECAVEHRGGADLYAVGRGPRGLPLAVGRQGVLLERSPRGEWSALTLEANRARLQTVLETARDVYVAGSGGVILRHPRID